MKPKSMTLSCKLGDNEIQITIDPRAKDICRVVENKVHYTVDLRQATDLLVIIGVLMKSFDRLPKKKVKGFEEQTVPDTLPESF